MRYCQEKHIYSVRNYRGMYPFECCATYTDSLYFKQFFITVSLIQKRTWFGSSSRQTM